MKYLQQVALLDALRTVVLPDGGCKSATRPRHSVHVFPHFPPPPPPRALQFRYAPCSSSPGGPAVLPQKNAFQELAGAPGLRAGSALPATCWAREKAMFLARLQASEVHAAPVSVTTGGSLYLAPPSKNTSLRRCPAELASDGTLRSLPPAALRADSHKMRWVTVGTSVLPISFCDIFVRFSAR
jgi:hypothetical protein